MRKSAVLILLLSFPVMPALASGASVQPYIEHLKQHMPPSEKSGREGSFIDSVREGLPSAPSESYIDQVRAGWDDESSEPKKPSLIEREKARLSNSPTGQSGGAIEKLKTGKSELELKRPGEIGKAMGIRVGATLTRNITSTNGVGTKNFSDFYGKDRVPEINFFYEFQPFHSEWFGSIGFFGSGGFGFDSGKGTFAYTPPNVVPGGTPFSAESRTRFYFFYFPVVAGLDYRFNLFRVLRPFAMVGPALIPYWETRNDSKSGIKGYSNGLFMTAGVSLLLDFLSRDAAWDLYAAHDVKHYYLTVDYSSLTTRGGDVRFDVSGYSAGFTFEF